MATAFPGLRFHAAPRRRALRRCRGSSIAYFIVILGLICTSLLTTMSLAGIGGAQIAHLNTRRDGAFYAAEAGVQRSLWELRFHNWSGRSYPPINGLIGDSFYSVTANLNGLFGSGIPITAVGSTGLSPSSTLKVTATLGPRHGIPAVSVGGSIGANSGSGGGSLTIGGNVYFYGDSINRNSNNFDVTLDANSQGGDFYYTDPTVDTSRINFLPGHGAHNEPTLPPPPDVPAMISTLTQGGTRTPWANTSVIDLTAAGGVAYINGSVTIDSATLINGSGIIVVNGDATISRSFPFNGNTITIVALGNVTFDPGNQTNNFLGIYAGGSVTNQSKCVITGLVSADQSFDSSGALIVNFDPSVIPLADTRLTNGSSSDPLVVCAFIGPIK